MSAARFIRTIRHLRCSQWFWRARYGVGHRLTRQLRLRSDRRWQGVSTNLDTGEFVVPPVWHRPHPTDAANWEALCQGRFAHLNREVDLGSDKRNWLLDHVDVNRLWAITLHYHHWVFELAEAERSGYSNAFQRLEQYLDEWWQCTTSQCDGGSKLAWNAFAVATRIGWWIRALCLLGREYLAQHPQFYRKTVARICQQADYLARHIEWDLRANHVLRDAVGLAWAGRFIRGPHGEQWLRKATKIAVGQVNEQVLPDGGHFERSPMYHIHVMEDVLLLSHLLDDEDARRRMYEAWSRMADALAWLRHPDGQIVQLNDAALDAACKPEDMLQHESQTGTNVDVRPRIGGKYFPNTGLVIWHGKPWSVFFDVGEIGPAIQPGHAHADTLTLECSYQGSRLFVDPGTYGYEDSMRRIYDRSTAAHNTVCIDGKDSSEVWHVFRAGRRARPLDVEVEFTVDGLCCRAAHNGYHYLPGRPTHRRRIHVRDGGSLQIIDEIDGRGEHEVAGGLLLAPGWTAELQPDGWTLIQDGTKRLRVGLSSSQPVQLAIELSPLHREFHVEILTQRLIWRTAGPLPLTVQAVVEEAASPRHQSGRKSVMRERLQRTAT